MGNTNARFAVTDMVSPDTWISSELDHIDCDLLSPGIPMHLTYIGRLPTELLLKIAREVTINNRRKAQDLFNLALVCHRLRAVAEDSLYSSLDLSASNEINLARHVERVTQCWEALHKLPAQAFKVIELEIWLLVDYKIPFTIPTGRTSISQRSTEISSSDTVVIQSSWLCGFLPYLLPNLQVFTVRGHDLNLSTGDEEEIDEEEGNEDEGDEEDFEVAGNDNNEDRNEADEEDVEAAANNDHDGWYNDDEQGWLELLNTMFGRDKSGIYLHDVKPFAKLRSLYLGVIMVGSDRCMVPTLRELTTGRSCNINEVSSMTRILKVERLKMDTDDAFLDIDGPEWESIVAYLFQFPFVKELVISVQPCYHWTQEDMENRQYSTVSTILSEQPFRSNLESLSLILALDEDDEDGYSHPNPLWYLSHIIPIDTLVDLTNTRYLRIPYTALPENWGSRVNTLLPMSVQELHIDYPKRSIRVDLADIDNRPASLPNLHTINLHVWTDNYNDDLEQAFFIESSILRKQYRFRLRLWYGSWEHPPFTARQVCRRRQKSIRSTVRHVSSRKMGGHFFISDLANMLDTSILLGAKCEG